MQKRRSSILCKIAFFLYINMALTFSIYSKFFCHETDNENKKNVLFLRSFISSFTLNIVLISLHKYGQFTKFNIVWKLRRWNNCQSETLQKWKSDFSVTFESKRERGEKQYV